MSSNSSAFDFDINSLHLPQAFPTTANSSTSSLPSKPSEPHIESLDLATLLKNPHVSHIFKHWRTTLSQAVNQAINISEMQICLMQERDRAREEIQQLKEELRAMKKGPVVEEVQRLKEELQAAKIELEAAKTIRNWTFDVEVQRLKEELQAVTIELESAKTIRNWAFDVGRSTSAMSPSDLISHSGVINSRCSTPQPSQPPNIPNSQPFAIPGLGSPPRCKRPRAESSTSNTRTKTRKKSTVSVALPSSSTITTPLQTSTMNTASHVSSAEFNSDALKGWTVQDLKDWIHTHSLTVSPRACKDALIAAIASAPISNRPTVEYINTVIAQRKSKKSHQKNALQG